MRDGVLQQRIRPVAAHACNERGNEPLAGMAALDARRDACPVREFSAGQPRRRLTQAVAPPP